MMINLFKTRSRKLKELGFANYGAYLASDHWRRRRSEFERSHPKRCAYCGSAGEQLHHRRYRNLGAELDEDVEWVCDRHHEEISKYGSIQPPTERQRAILVENGYDTAFIDASTFGSAFELIGEISRGLVRPPIAT